MKALAALLLTASSPLWAAAPKPVHIKTADGWTLLGLYAAPKKGMPVAVLVHGVAAGKEEWGGFAEALRRHGFGTLAIDLRGHGGSTSGPEGHETFADFDARGEWPKALGDLLAAARWLNKKGIATKRIGFVGGSIGANLASEAAPQLGAPWAVLLSPGFDYRGARLGDLTKVNACVAASPNDPYAFQTAVSLSTQAVFLQGPGGHGAQMLSDPAFVDKLLGCLSRAAGVKAG